MERFDVSESDRLAEMVSAAQAGLEVEITRDGTVVARVVPTGSVPAAAANPAEEFLARVARITEMLPPELLGGNAGAEIRAMRDEAW